MVVSMVGMARIVVSMVGLEIAGEGKDHLLRRIMADSNAAAERNTFQSRLHGWQHQIVSKLNYFCT